jgi:hypothetical protein
MDGFDSVATDVDLLYGTGDAGPPSTFPPQFVVPYGIPFVHIDSSDAGGNIQNLYRTGQIKGAIIGLRGGAEFELLTGIPGKNSSYMFGSLLSTAFVVIGLIVSNIVFIVIPKLRGRSEG